jgi:hypothetical protein
VQGYATAAGWASATLMVAAVVVGLLVTARRPAAGASDHH